MENDRQLQIALELMLISLCMSMVAGRVFRHMLADMFGGLIAEKLRVEKCQILTFERRA